MLLLAALGFDNTSSEVKVKIKIRRRGRGTRL
jgi:hypothetical protein